MAQATMTQTKQAPTAGTTLVEIFQQSVKENAKTPAFQVKKGDSWESKSYRWFGERVLDVAAGISSLGVGKGDRVAIFSKNSPEWAQTDWACQLLGAVTVPIYDTLNAATAAYILRDSGAKLCVVQSQEHLDKIRETRNKTAKLENVVLVEEIFEKSLHENELLFHTLVQKGKQLRQEKPDLVKDAAKRVAPNDWASIVYTSGTTGEPKGAILTHDNFASNVRASEEVIPIGAGDVMLSFLPLSHVFERMGGHFRAVASGATVAYSQGIDHLATDMIETRPHVMLSVPRLYEKLYARITEKVSKDSFLKRKIFNWALNTGKQYAHEKFELKVRNPSTEKKFKRADKLVFSKIRDRTGGRLKFFVSGGAPLSKEIAAFFTAVNIPILQGYGLTETSPVITANNFDAYRIGSCGVVFPRIECRIADDGEVQVKGPNVFQGYYNKPEATKEVFTDDGWFMTGDIGHFDEDGFLFITDRKKELIVMSNGKNVAPQPIENMLKTKPGVAQAALIGDSRKFISGLLAPDEEYLTQFAEDNKIAFESIGELLEHDKVKALFEEAVELVNADLPRHEQLKTYRVTDHEWTLETGELTPTMKIKRRVIDEMYADQIASMYPQDPGTNN